MSFYSAVVRPLLFRLDAETAHHWTVEACRLAGMVPGVTMLSRTLLEVHSPLLETEAFGLRFSNPIGLAAGWDKSGRALRILDALGFGFAEIGSVSARPSQGNPRPRLFRLPEDRAIIVNYGLPNDGAEVVAARLRAHRPLHPLGVNIVKTNDGPGAPPCRDEDILADYERSVRLLHLHAGYLTLNLSCPNAKGGKDFFAQPGNISRFLECLCSFGITCPVILKIAPRDEPAEHERVLLECEPFPFVRGFCFNLPQGKPESLEFISPRSAFAHQPGAVSGKPVASLINRCIAGLYAKMDRQRYILIGTGGVFSAEDAYTKIRLGASLVQIYTAMIYEGPGVVKRISSGLVDLLERDGFHHVAEAVGCDHLKTTNLSEWNKS
jgi:dihydroorotate dehydrogenase